MTKYVSSIGTGANGWRTVGVVWGEGWVAAFRKSQQGYTV